MSLIYVATLGAKPEHVRVREWRWALRQTMLEGAIRFHSKFVKGKKRFKTGVAGSLAWKTRTAKYTAWKQKAAALGRRINRNGIRYTVKGGGLISNLLTGVTAQAMELPEIRGFPSRARIRYPMFPKYARTRPDFRKGSRPWVGNELARASSAEAADFVAFAEKRIQENIKQAIKNNTKRKA